uniref:Uncharacterized protein n=1 Tax=Anopheles culicifacies TaxID=139723 RepID=A0A182MI43_9DIPT
MDFKPPNPMKSVRKEPAEELQEGERIKVEKSTDGNKQPKKRGSKKTAQDTAEAPVECNNVSNDEAKHNAKKPKTSQWINSAIEPTIQHQAGNPSRSFLYVNVHHDILQLPMQPNVINQDTLLDHFQITRPFSAAYAMPLHTTTGIGPSTPDLMVRALVTKQTYQNELKSLETKYKTVSRNYPLPPGDAKHVQHSVTLAYAALLDRDPDPYLELCTGYDYHYTGGSMVTLRSTSTGCTDTIFKATGANLEDVEVLRIGVSVHDDLHCEEDLAVKDVQRYTVGMAGPILEIVPGTSGTVVLVRKRNVIIVMREVETTPNVKEWRAVQKFFATYPFASVCFVTGPASCEMLTLCTTDYRKQLQLWTVNDDDASCEDIIKFAVSNSTLDNISPLRPDDRWSAVRSVDGHSLVACLDRRRIRFYKVLKEGRSTAPNADTYRLVHRGISDFSSWTSECEQCCALETTPSEGLLFVATCHKLIVGRIEKKVVKPQEGNDPENASVEADEETMEFKMLLVFAHNLRQRPVYISHQWEAAIANDKERHFVLFGSHLPMNYGIASFTRTDPTTPVYVARHYPYHPPTFHDTYKQAQTRGFCISTYEPLQKRFYACQSGAVLIRGTPPNAGDEPRLHILLQTSAGDLLQQRVTYNFDRSETNVDRISTGERKQKMALVLQHWHELLGKQAGKIPYRATSFKTMTKFRDIFNCPMEGSELQKVLFLPPEVKKKRKKVSRTIPSAHDDTTDSEEGSQSENEDDEGLGSSFRDGTSSRSYITHTGAKRRRRREKKNVTTVRWNQTIEELQQYRDVLAAPMLGVWGIGDTAALAQSTKHEPIPTKLPPLEDINERVGSWVNNTSIELGRQEDMPEEHDHIGELFSMPKAPAFEAVTDEYSVRDLFTQSWAPSQTSTASQPSQQQVEPSGRAQVKPSKRVYTKGF